MLRHFVLCKFLKLNMLNLRDLLSSKLIYVIRFCVTTLIVICHFAGTCRCNIIFYFLNGNTYLRTEAKPQITASLYINTYIVLRFFKLKYNKDTDKEIPRETDLLSGFFIISRKFLIIISD